jgi:hypothetical protein
MAETARAVTLTMKTQVDPSADVAFGKLTQSAGSVSKAAREADVSITRMARSAASEVRTLDRGVGFLARGFSGLTQNLFITSTALQGAGGHLGKLAEQSQRAAGALLLIHSAASTFRGLVAVTTTAGSAVASYTATAYAAAVANRALANSHEVASEAALAHANAEQAVTGAIGGAGGGGRFGMGRAVAYGVAGTAGFTGGAALARSQGLGVGGQIAGGALGAAGGLGVVKLGSSLISAGGAGALGAGAGVALGGIALGVGLHEGARSLLGMQPGGVRALYNAWTDKTADRMQAREAQLQAMRQNREAAFSLSYGAQSPFLERQRALGIAGAGVADQYGLQVGATGTAYALSQQIQNAGGVAFATPINRLKDLPGYAQHQAGLAQQIGDIARGNAASSIQSGIGVQSADRERARAAAELADKERAIATWKATANRTDAEGQALTQQLAQAQDRLLQAEEKRLDALRAQGKVQAENAQQWSNLAREQSQYYRGLALAEADRQKSAKEEFALLDPTKRRGLLETSRRLRDLDEGRAQPGRPEWAIVNGRPRQVGGGVGLNAEQLEIAKSNPLLRDQLNRVAVNSLNQQDQTAYQELLRNSGATQKLSDLDRSAKLFERLETTINNNVRAELTLNEKSLADQLANTIVPEITKAVNAARVGAELATDAASKAAGANRRALAGSQGGS